MIAGAVVVPSPPMILPEYIGLEDPAGRLRLRCVEALRTTLEGPTSPDSVVIVTGAEPAPRTSKRPLGVRIGEHLLVLAGWTGPVEWAVVPFDAETDVVDRAGSELAEHPDRLMLLVVADGSARRGVQAPGHLDDRAFGVDADIVKGLSDADPEVLLGIDAEVAYEVLAQGRAALQVLARAVSAAPLTGHVLWSGDPYGVLYVLARWTRPAELPT